MKKLFILIFLGILAVNSAYADNCSIVKGTVWSDENADGIQNDNATLVTDGIKVYLYNEDNELVDESSVDENGKYEFDVVCGTYYIKVDKGDYNYYSPMNVGDDDLIDSDVNSNGKSELFDIDAGETKVLDAGLNCGCDEKATLNGKVWFDKNSNGVEDAGESGIEGVVIHLLKEGEDTGVTTTTDSNGNYEFSDLECGFNYSIKVDKPSAYDNFTKENIGNDDSKDSDVNSRGVSDEVGIDECQDYSNLDAGLIKNDDNGSGNDNKNENKTACIGDFMWYDKNLNGIEDKNEPGVVGIGVYLYDNNGKLLATTQTDSNGKYNFCGLSDGEYKVKFDEPDTYLFTKRDIGDDSKDSDVDSKGWSHNIIIKDAKDDYSIDAGLYCECDDYKVNTKEYKKLKADISLEMILGLLLFIVIATATLKYRKDMPYNEEN